MIAPDQYKVVVSWRSQSKFFKVSIVYIQDRSYNIFSTTTFSLTPIATPLPGIDLSGLLPGVGSHKQPFYF